MLSSIDFESNYSILHKDENQQIFNKLFLHRPTYLKNNPIGQSEHKNKNSDYKLSVLQEGRP
jgi:hypothetical protein